MPLETINLWISSACVFIRVFHEATEFSRSAMIARCELITAFNLSISSLSALPAGWVAVEGEAASIDVWLPRLEPENVGV